MPFGTDAGLKSLSICGKWGGVIYFAARPPPSIDSTQHSEVELRVNTLQTMCVSPFSGHGQSRTSQSIRTLSIH